MKITFDITGVKYRNGVALSKLEEEFDNEEREILQKRFKFFKNTENEYDPHAIIAIYDHKDLYPSYVFLDEENDFDEDVVLGFIKSEHTQAFQTLAPHNLVVTDIESTFTNRHGELASIRVVLDKP